MKTSDDINRTNRISKRRRELAELSYTLSIRAARLPDIYLAAEYENVTAIDGPGGTDRCHLTITAQCVGNTRGFRSPRLRTRSRDDRNVAKNNRCIFDKHGIRKIRSLGKMFHSAAEVREFFFVLHVLLDRLVDIDRHTIEMRQLARHQARRDGASQGNDALCQAGLRGVRYAAVCSAFALTITAHVPPP